MPPLRVLFAAHLGATDPTGLEPSGVLLLDSSEMPLAASVSANLGKSNKQSGVIETNWPNFSLALSQNYSGMFANANR